MRKVIVGLMLTSLLAACASQKPKETTPPPEQKPAATTSESSNAAPTQVNPLDDPNSILAKRSTYYPFDVSVVQPDDRALVAAHAAYLKAHPDQKVRLEGNCDERGSAEYNLGLGQRRADGVEKLLIAGGADRDGPGGRAPPPLPAPPLGGPPSPPRRRGPPPTPRVSPPSPWVPFTPPVPPGASGPRGNSVKNGIENVLGPPPAKK